MFNSDDYLSANEDDERYFFRDHRERPMSRRELWMVTQDHTPVTGNCAFCGAQIEAPRSVVMAPCACGRYTAIRSLLAGAAGDDAPPSWENEPDDECPESDWHDISAPCGQEEIRAAMVGAAVGHTDAW